MAEQIALERARQLLNESVYEEDSVFLVIERWKEQAVVYEQAVKDAKAEGVADLRELVRALGEEVEEDRETRDRSKRGNPLWEQCNQAAKTADEIKGRIQSIIDEGEGK